MYVDERENPYFILRMDEEQLFARLGLIDFQIEQYGSYDPHKILEIDFRKRGREVFQRHLGIIRLKICGLYDDMRKSGVLDTTEKVYFFIVGFLMASDVNRAIAVGVAAIAAKQGLYSLCRQP